VLSLIEICILNRHKKRALSTEFYRKSWEYTALIFGKFIRISVLWHLRKAIALREILSALIINITVT
jgi:hypothetical protein